MLNRWFSQPLVLTGSLVSLEPLTESNLSLLFQAAQDQEIWKLTSVNYSDQSVFYANFQAALLERSSGKSYCFVIILRATGEIIGTTRFLEISQSDKKLEIGVTWIASQYWGSSVNRECKLLLLSYCFEMLEINRVQFRAKAENGRSRRALEKVGAKFEGIFRMDKMESNGLPRNTAFYSIILPEWKETKAALLLKMAEDDREHIA